MAFDISYTYDGAGNRLTMTSGSDVTTYTYSAANRIQTANLNGAVTTYTHDGSGNRIKKQDPSSLTTYGGWHA